MATKTVTVDTNEWKYVDSFGDEHTITDAETFTFELTDDGVAAVTYAVDEDESVTTTDGYTIEFIHDVEGLRSQTTNTTRQIGPLADANDAASVRGIKGELVAKCPKSGRIQRWTIAEFTVDDVDAPTAITSATLEDQFGNKMTIPNSGSGITVA